MSDRPSAASATQRANVWGNQNIIVQAEGNNIRVNVRGLPHLTLAPPGAKVARTPIKTDFDLLLAQHRAIPLIGRDDALESLREWLNSDRDISVRTVSGQAGCGKTRLAIELTIEVADDWDAGFVDDGEMRRFSAQQSLATWSWQRPTLVVVDYAAALLDPLMSWLKELASRAIEQDAPSLRLLLLERQAASDSGWLRFLHSEEFSDSSVVSLFDPMKPMGLEALGDVSHRREILSRTMARATALNSKPAPALPEPGVDPYFDARLKSDSWIDPLSLMMAALVAVESGVAEALSLSRRDLALELAKRRLKGIRRFGSGGVQGAEADLLAHMAAYVTLCQGMSHADANAAAAEELEAMGRTHPDGHGALVDKLERAMPGEPSIAPIKPDIIGEAACLIAIGNEAAGAETVLRAAGRPGSAVAATIIRAAQNFSFEDPREDSSNVRTEPMSWIELLVERGQTDDVGLLLSIDSAMPHDTLILREKAASVCEVLLVRLTVIAGDAPSDALRSEIARLNNNLANRLSDLGRREHALAAAQEAVQLHRQLAADRPDALLPNLALSLNNLAVRLSDLGRREDALAVAAEAVKLYRRLAAARPDAFLSNLAMSLSNLAKMLSQLGCREDALAAAEEAVQLRRQLAADRPDAFLPDLALSLNNLANALSDVGHPEDALVAAEEAVKFDRQLAAARPDAFLPNLATSLWTLNLILAGLGRHGDATGVAEEGLRLLMPMFVKSPQAFMQLTHDLARVYIESSKAAGLEPDLELLKPLAEMLQAMQKERGSEPPDDSDD